MDPHIVLNESNEDIKTEKLLLSVSSAPLVPHHTTTPAQGDTLAASEPCPRDGWVLDVVRQGASSPRYRYRGRAARWARHGRAYWQKGVVRPDVSRQRSGPDQGNYPSQNTVKTTETDSSNHLQGTRKCLGLGKKLWNLLHRYLWLILQVIASIISYIYIKDAYRTWQASPVVVSVNNTKTYVWEIPFPAVTLCSLPTLNKDYNFTGQFSKCFECYNADIYKNCSLSTRCNFSELAAVSLAYTMCVQTVRMSNDILGDEWESLVESIFDNTSLQEGYSSYLKEILPECTFFYHYEDLSGCPRWQTLLMGTTREFGFIEPFDQPADPPVCYTFNTLKIQDLYEDHVVPSVIDEREDKYESKVAIKNRLWTTDNMMDFADKEISLPWYGLEHLFFRHTDEHSDQNFGICSGGGEVKPWIGFHHPGEVPMMENTKFYTFSGGKSLMFYISPNLMSAHKNLVDYEPAKRMCYFAHEHKLSLFKFYTEKNCQLECKANCTLEKCGCIPYNLPRHNKSVKLCSRVGWKCSVEIKSERTIFYRAGTKWIEEDTPLACICDCLPDCNSLSYDFEVEEKAKFDFTYYTDIKILFKANAFSSFVRYGVNSWAEFVAYSLGILGVFNGLCGVGLCEAVYHRTLKVMHSCSKLWTNGHSKKDSDKNIVSR